MSDKPYHHLKEDYEGVCAHSRKQDAEIERLRAALGEFAKWFENSGSSINARWDRVPAEDRVKIVKGALDALKQ